jgi:hypothetical protein
VGNRSKVLDSSIRRLDVLNFNLVGRLSRRRVIKACLLLKLEQVALPVHFLEQLYFALIALAVGRMLTFYHVLIVDVRVSLHPWLKREALYFYVQLAQHVLILKLIDVVLR